MYESPRQNAFLFVNVISHTRAFEIGEPLISYYDAGLIKT